MATVIQLASEAAMRRQKIDHQIVNLGREWNYVRVLEAEAAFTGLTALILGLNIDRWWLEFQGLLPSMGFLHINRHVGILRCIDLCLIIRRR